MSSPRRDRIEAASHLMAEGRHGEAEILVVDLLAEAPDDVDVLLLHAILTMGKGAVPQAFDLLSELATQVPDRADVVANLGVAHAALNRPEDALACLERAVLLAPDDARRRCELGRLLLAQDDLARARAEIAEAQRLADAGDDATLKAEGWSIAAALLVLEGNASGAEAAIGRALALRPAHGEDLALMSGLLARRGQVEQALGYAERAYVAAPADHGRALALAACLAELGRMAEAERLVRRVVATAPAHGEAQDALARLLILQGDAAGGLAGFANMVRRSSQDPATLLAMARLLRLSGDLEKALAFAEEALKRAPETQDARQMRAHVLMALGRFEAVWPARRDDVAEDGSSPALLEVPEGLAAEEVLLLARFARRLAPAGGRVPCRAEAALLPLMEGLAGLAPHGPAAAQDAAIQGEACPLTALPELLGIGAEDLDAAPYLAVEAEHFERWRAAVAHLPRPLIGLTWDKGPAGITLAALAQALDGAGTLVSMVFDGRRADLRAQPAVLDAGAHFADARDLAAAVAQLDLVVGADGLALHVAGAMGRPGVVAVPAALPWIWAHRDGRALWYPAIQVVRQDKPGRWDGAIEALAQAARRMPAAQVEDVA